MAAHTRQRRLAVLTSTRADYGLWRPLLAELEARGRIAPRLIVTGTHLEARHGATVREIVADGRRPWREIPLGLGDDSARTAARAIARLAESLGALFNAPQTRPDALALLGDRFELMGAASAALVARVPVFHVHGGEVTEGAIDDAVRHAVSKMASLHFVSTSDHRRRLIQMGEPEARVHVTGALALDAVKREKVLAESELCSRLGLAGGRLPQPLIVVTYHPLTRDPEAGRRGLEALVAALEKAADLFVVWTAPNADPGAAGIRRAAEAFARRHRTRAVFVESLGHVAYLSLLRHALAVVGNSSSGIIEAPAIPTATIDIGRRQQGRPKAASVLSCPEDAGALSAALERVRAPAFRRGLADVRHPFGDGRAAARIADVLEQTEAWSALVEKPFCDRTVTAEESGRASAGEEAAWAVS